MEYTGNITDNIVIVIDNNFFFLKMDKNYPIFF